MEKAARSVSSPLVKGIFFDLEGTLNHSRITASSRMEACRHIGRFLADNGIDIDILTLGEVIREGMEAYERWKVDHLREIPASHLWADMVFRSFDPLFRDRLRKHAAGISYLWEEHCIQRRLRRGVVGILKALREKGFVLGLVSNVLHSERAKDYLAAKGLAEHFRIVILSQEVGYRKPHPVIFQEAARLAGIHPGHALFVGDTVSRDIAGAQKAGYAYTVLIRSELTELKDGGGRGTVPDFTLPDLQALPVLVENLSRQGRLFGGLPTAQ